MLQSIRSRASYISYIHAITFFSREGGMVVECKRYHRRLAEQYATKKGESYMTTMSWIRAEASFALLRPALLCLRGSGVLEESI